MLLQKDKINTIAIGGFDGIHRGHRELIKKLGKNGALVVIDKEDANLTPMAKRSEYSKYPCMFYHFSKIKHLYGEEFISLLKKDFPNLQKIVVGYDFTFGKAKSHEARDLKNLFDGDVEIIDEYFYDGISVHSSIIRQKIKDGHIVDANRLLGREYTITGDVIKGQGLGKKRLYPTLNLHILNFLIPKNGVYATRTMIGDKVYDSVSFVGTRHSTDKKFSIETHILDATNIEQPRWVKLSFVAYLRENEKFDDLDKLKKQIQKDIKKAKQSLIACKIEFEGKSR
ncbi:MAG: bifunctional riboflavin kinase/FMN adenylyltransferase [Proteobacteria bacterium]|nr:MAG: bifunctional riboflavin kinase/FMN adenylyltransferase [Pseudomonadota bacterium]